MKGHYKHYPVSVRLLEKHKFCTLDEFQNFINKHEYIEMSNSLVQSNIWLNFQKLRIQAPFCKTIRFPDNFYVHMDCVKIRTVSKQFWNALCLLIFWQRNRMDCTSANVMEYINNRTVIQQPYEAAFTEFVDVSISTENLKKNGIYCRETFEKKYDLTWIATDV